MFFDIFPKRLGIFSPHFTRLLYVPIYARLHFFNNFYPRDAMLRAGAGLCDSDVSVRLSVRYSRYCIKTEKASVVIYSILHHLIAHDFTLARYDSSKIR